MTRTRRSGIETMKMMIMEVLGLAVVAIFLYLLLFTGGFPDKAVASAKVVCFATNSVYGDVESGGWVTADQINDQCELKQSASSTGTITGAITGLATTLESGPRVRCEQGMWDDDQVGCEVENFELPQTTDLQEEFSGEVKRSIPGAGDPDYILYYGEFPKIEAESAWGFWAAVSAIPMAGKLAEGMQLIARGGKTVGRIVVKTARYVPVPGTGTAARIAVQGAKQGATFTIQAGSAFARKAGRYGYAAGDTVTGATVTAVNIAHRWGFHGLAEDGVQFAPRAVRNNRGVRFVVETFDPENAWFARRVSGFWHVNVRGYVWLLEHNGLGTFNTYASRETVQHLHRIGKISTNARDDALKLIDDDGYEVVKVLRETEAKHLDNTLESGMKLTRADIATILEEDRIIRISSDEAAQLVRALDADTTVTEQMVALTPTIFAIKKGGGGVDALVGLTNGGGSECVFTLRKQTSNNRVKRALEHEEMTFSMSHCKNQDELRTSPTETEQAGVNLVKFRSTEIRELDFQLLGDVTTRFYAASPCLSTTSEARSMVGYGTVDLGSPFEATGQEFRVYADNEQVKIHVPVSSEDYYPNFCWWYPALNVAQWPFLNDIVKGFNFIGLNIEEVDLWGVSPWPCHGIYALSTWRDTTEGWVEDTFGELGQFVFNLATFKGFFGTCGQG